MSVLGKFEVDNANILRFEGFLANSMKLIYQEPKMLHFLKYFLSFGESLLFCNKIKGENFGFSLQNFESSIEKFLGAPLLSLKMGSKLLKLKQKIQDLKTQNKVTYFNSFNNSLILHDYFEKRQEIYQENNIEENIEDSFSKNNEISQNIAFVPTIVLENHSHSICNNKDSHQEVAKVNIETETKKTEVSKINMDFEFNRIPIESLRNFNKENERNFEFVEECEKFSFIDPVNKKFPEVAPAGYSFLDIAQMPKINLEED